MIPWILLDKAALPDNGKELTLNQRGGEYSIRINTLELMNSRAHNSEVNLARLACQKITKHKEQNILIGGLGMGFTLKAALTNLKANASVTVAELFPAVVKWNRTFLSDLAGNPLNDKRVSVYEGDVSYKIKVGQNTYHAILLDVDNGADGLTQKKNDSLYTPSGLKAAYAALRPEGVLAIWSAAPDNAFIQRLRKSGFASVEETLVRARKGSKGGRQSVVWLAVKNNK